MDVLFLQNKMMILDTKLISCSVLIGLLLKRHYLISREPPSSYGDNKLWLSCTLSFTLFNNVIYILLNSVFIVSWQKINPLSPHGDILWKNNCDKSTNIWIIPNIIFLYNIISIPNKPHKVFLQTWQGNINSSIQVNSI